MSELSDRLLAGLTWYSEATEHLDGATSHIGQARPALRPDSEYFALYMINQARADLDAAEATIRRTLAAHAS